MILIVVPYGNLTEEERRAEQRQLWIEHMKTYCESLLHKDIHIIIAEQVSPKTLFNRGQLLNAGVFYFCQRHALAPSNIVFHDIDMLPDANLVATYANGSKAMYLTPNTATHRKLYGFPLGAGGICSMKHEVFAKINGYPNTFWGWGGEDNAIEKRLKANGIRASRNTRGDYKSTDAQRTDHRSKMNFLKSKGLRNMTVWEKLEHDGEHWKEDGYAQLASSKLTIVEERPIYQNTHPKGGSLLIEQIGFALDEAGLAGLETQESEAQSSDARSKKNAIGGGVPEDAAAVPLQIKRSPLRDVSLQEAVEMIRKDRRYEVEFRLRPDVHTVKKLLLRARAAVSKKTLSKIFNEGASKLVEETEFNTRKGTWMRKTRVAKCGRAVLSLEEPLKAPPKELNLAQRDPDLIRTKNRLSWPLQANPSWRVDLTFTKQDAGTLGADKQNAGEQDAGEQAKGKLSHLEDVLKLDPVKDTERILAIADVELELEFVGEDLAAAWPQALAFMAKYSL
jgi:hypothetical protein